jgi:hypothetical protein
MFDIGKNKKKIVSYLQDKYFEQDINARAVVGTSKVQYVRVDGYFHDLSLSYRKK